MESENIKHLLETARRWGLHLTPTTDRATAMFAAATPAGRELRLQAFARTLKEIEGLPVIER